MVPFEKNPCFVGRNGLVEHIFEKLCDAKPYQYNNRIALYGMGGVGKTQTALEYVYRKRSYYDSIFWISGVNQVVLLSGFQQIAEETKCADGTNASNPSELVKIVLHWLQQHPISLLVIDNVDDVSIIDGLLPSPDSKGHTLITTRNPNTDGIPAQGLEIDVLEIDVAAALFCLHLIAQTTLNAPEIVSEIRNIVNELGCLPLAIEQSAAFLRETKRPIHSFLPLYRQNRSQRQRLHKWVPEGNRKYRYSVATTWRMSFDHIQQDADCPEAATLLQLLAFLNPDLILIEFLQAGSSALDECLRNMLQETMEFEAALRVLRRFSLIKRIQNGGGVWIHRLVQESIQHDMKEEIWLAWWDSVIELCLNAFPNETNEATRQLCRKYEEQVLVPLLKCPRTKSPTFTTACMRVGNFLQDDGKYKQAESLFDKSHKIYQETHGERHPSTLTAMGNLASTYWNQGRWDEAVVLDEKVLEVRKEVLGERHPSTLTAMTNLASTYRNQGRWDEAVVLEEKVLEVRKEVLGERHPDTLTAMANLASTYWNQGRWDEAVVLDKKVLEVSKQVLGERHPDTLTTMVSRDPRPDRHTYIF